MSLSAILTLMGIPSAITAFCFWLLQVQLQKRDAEQKVEREARQKEIDERDKQRKEYELCQLNMITATMALAEATAVAVERIPDAHCNGDMHKAMAFAEKIKNEQKNFLKKQAIENLDL